ncbi:unnamed protein product [Merluccius merluccius]
MKLVALSLMCLWGLLCLCTSAYATDNFIAELADAARDFHGLLPCGNWDCKCANQQRDCCCAAKEMMTLEDTTFNWMMDLWLDVKDLEIKTNALTGVFTALFPGTYSFSYTVYSNVGHQNERLYHKVVVLHLRRGCQVYMELVAGRSLSGDMTFNRFSGFLLYHD